MADILIRGMEMPKGCFDCNFCSLGNGFCYGLKRYVNESRKREKDCPLIPLPEGHGRLIDADAPIRVAYFDGTIHETTPSRLLCKHSLLDLPKTIVPAEGGGEDG